MPAAPSLLDQIIVAAVGAAVTGIVGTLAVGVVLQMIARRSQDRREASTLRPQLIAELTEVAGKASIALSFYRRLRKECAGSTDHLAERRLRNGRDRLEAQHIDSRVRGWVIEKRLQVHYGRGSAPEVAWHKTLDCLNALFLQLTDQWNVSAHDYDSMAAHTGLDTTAMRDYEAVRDVLTSSLSDAAQHVLSTPMVSPRSRPSGGRRHRRSPPRSYCARVGTDVRSGRAPGRSGPATP